MRRCLFVDYENVSSIGAAPLDTANLEVWVFVGPNQKGVTLKSLLQFGSKIGIVQIAREGKNSLDFHICYELGVLSRDDPKPDVVYVLSKDKGYDAVLEYAKTRGLAVERIPDVARLAPAKVSSRKGGPADTILARLRKLAAGSRPRTLSSLRSYLQNQLKAPADVVSAAVDQLVAEGRLVQENGRLKYNL